MIETIRARLDYLGWSWADLARAMKLSEQRVNNWRTRGIPARQMRKVEAALGLKRDALDVVDAQQASEIAVTEIRRARLKQWFADQRLPENEKSYLSQLIHGKVSFGEKAARRLEKDYKMPDGHLDSLFEQDRAPGAKTRATESGLLEAWAYLLPTEKEAVMEQIRPMAAHNKAVLEHYSKS